MRSRKKFTGDMINPRASNEWSRDKAKLGQKLLEKMGWSEGQGIGLNNQGIKENVKLNVKQDKKGLGFKIMDEMDWIGIQDSFNNLLSELGGCSSFSNDDNDRKIVKSLEFRSQQSKSRLHYKKFTKGKDISSYGEKELSCILGFSNNNNNNSCKSDETDNCQNVIYGGSIKDYFSRKKLNKKCSMESEPNEHSVNSGEETNKKFEKNLEQEMNSVIVKSKKKMKKYTEIIFEETIEENVQTENNCEEEIKNEDFKNTKIKKKKKKLKDNTQISDVIVKNSIHEHDYSSNIEMDNNFQNSGVEKIITNDNNYGKTEFKKKRKKIRNDNEYELNNCHNNDDDAIDQHAEKKKKYYDDDNNYCNNDDNIINKNIPNDDVENIHENYGAVVAKSKKKLKQKNNSEKLRKKKENDLEGQLLENNNDITSSNLEDDNQAGKYKNSNDGTDDLLLKTLIKNLNCDFGPINLKTHSKEFIKFLVKTARKKQKHLILEQIKSNNLIHQFEGTNLHDVKGYGVMRDTNLNSAEVIVSAEVEANDENLMIKKKKKRKRH